MSEEVLAAAILAFYKQIHGPTLPLGIAEEVLIKWAGKMAFGLREMASRFKRLLWESPIKAKSKKIQEMKKLYWDMHAKYGKHVAEGPKTLPAHDSVEVVESTGFDWVALEKRLEMAMAKKKEETQTKTLQASTKSKLGKRRQSFESTSSLASEELREGNPYLLPQYVGLLIDVRLSFIFSLYNLIGIEVVTSLKGAGCPPPVSVDPTETKEDEGFELSDEEEEKKKKKKGGTNKQKRKPKTKKTEKRQAAAQEAPAGGEGKKEKPLVEAPRVVEPKGPVVYEAKTFQTAMREFVKDKREAGMKYKEACEAWMRSDVRADMLSTLSISEMKKRRFC